MFERYSFSAIPSTIKELWSVEPTEDYMPVYNASPTTLLPVVTDLHPRGFSFFYWGIPPEWSKKKSVSKKLINAPKDEILVKKTYKNQFKSRRCLVPADGLYGWKQISKKGKVPYRFILTDQEPFWMAGIWDEFETDEGSILHTFSVITVPPVETCKDVFQEMPAILEKGKESIWLGKHVKEDELMELLKPFTQSEIGSYPVSIKVNNTSYNGRDLITPAPSTDQFGNYSLFD